ncbi:MAG: hypothetical protein H7287_07105 [Thermoleophilia bacterium]|nr:hypothetical protein [Thermoleophilia bacterium]
MADGITSTLRRRVRASGRRYWTTAELRGDHDGNSSALRVAISRLVNDGELRRVRRGVYWHGGRMSDGRLATKPVRSAATTARALVDGVTFGAAEWQATNALGLSTQLAAMETIAVSGRPPRPVPGIKFIDRSGRKGRNHFSLSEREVTFLEALDGWDRFVEVPGQEAVDRLVGVLNDGSVRSTALARASSTEPAAVRERLRLVLEAAGRTADARSVPRAVDKRTRDRALLGLRLD